MASQLKERESTDEKAFAKSFLPSESIVSDEVHSTVFVKKLLAFAISNVTYIRAMFPEEDFKDRYIGDLHVKILSSGVDASEGAKNLVKLLKGCFEALEKKYLESVTLWLFKKDGAPGDAMEAYIFKIIYRGDKVDLAVIRNNDVLSEVKTAEDVKSTTVGFLKALNNMVEFLEPLPIGCCLQIQLSYDPRRTPKDYHAKGFDRPTFDLKLPAEVDNFSIGQVKTNHHTMKLRINAKINKGLQDTSDATLTHGLDYSPSEYENLHRKVSPPGDQAEAPLVDTASLSEADAYRTDNVASKDLQDLQSTTGKRGVKRKRTKQRN